MDFLTADIVTPSDSGPRAVLAKTIKHLRIEVTIIPRIALYICIPRATYFSIERYPTTCCFINKHLRGFQIQEQGDVRNILTDNDAYKATNLISPITVCWYFITICSAFFTWRESPFEAAGGRFL